MHWFCRMLLNKIVTMHRQATNKIYHLQTVIQFTKLLWNPTMYNSYGSDTSYINIAEYTRKNIKFNDRMWPWLWTGEPEVSKRHDVYVRVIQCTKLFWNHTMHNKVMNRTRTTSNFEHAYTHVRTHTHTNKHTHGQR